LHGSDYPVNSPITPNPDVKATHARKAGASWLLMVITVLAVVATASLGGWQLRRASVKEAMAAQINEKNRLPALINIAQAAPKKRANNTPDDSDVQSLIHRRVQLRGTWLAAHTVFLDNRYMAGRPGFFVLTPLQLESEPRVVWVQRGWVPRDPQERTRLPVVPTPAGSITVKGRVVEAVSQVYALGESIRAETTPLEQATKPASTSSSPVAAQVSRIWQNLPTLDLGPQAQWLPVAVLQTALPDGVDADGLLRDWPAVDSGVAKHYGYAFQWFALCALIMVLYVWFQFLAPRRRAA
jgi:surfeit locus 1 family protein